MMRMLIFLIYDPERGFTRLSFLIFCGSCKKTIDNIKEDLMINLITSNTWVVVRYLDGPSNITSTFSEYEFKFHKSGQVDAVKDGVTQASGTWEGSESNQSITSEFPSSGYPFNKLTGVWIVTNTKSKPWRVFSHRFEGSKELVLDLQEKTIKYLWPNHAISVYVYRM